MVLIKYLMSTFFCQEHSNKELANQLISQLANPSFYKISFQLIL